MAPAILILAMPPLLATYVAVVILFLDLDKAYAQYMLIAPLAYVLGSIPWGYMILRVYRGIDVREYGSGRIGTSNVLRTAGKGIAALVLALDVSKGALAVLLARAASDTAAAEVTAGLVVLVGHNWPVFLAFRGGRGIGPGAGALAVIAPLSLVIGLPVFLLVTLSTRLLSLGSLTGITVVLAVVVIQVFVSDFSSAYLIFVGGGVAMIFWQHRDNIKRLLKNSERRMDPTAQNLLEQE